MMGKKWPPLTLPEANILFVRQTPSRKHDCHKNNATALSSGCWMDAADIFDEVSGPADGWKLDVWLLPDLVNHLNEPKCWSSKHCE